MVWRDWWNRRLADQLGNPQGFLGRRVANRLNGLNRSRISGAVDLLDLPSGATAADLGFGGGLGLRLMLDRVGTTGVVHGVDRSDTAVEMAEKTYGEELRAGGLQIHRSSMTDLPLGTGSIDGAITVNTVYFLDDEQLEAAFCELARVLKPSGHAVVGIGNPDAMSTDPLMAHGFRIRSIESLVHHAALAGLAQVGQREVGDAAAPSYLILLADSGH